MTTARGFDAGCLRYITVPVTIEVGFPEDMVICDICDFCRTENSGSRYRCQLNSKILPYHNKCIGPDCPLREAIEEAQKQMNEKENENDYV